MPHATRCKYIAICVNVFVIICSLSILAALYLFSLDTSGGNNSTGGEAQTTSESAAAPNSTRSLRHPGEQNSQQQQNASSDLANSKPLYLPSLLQDFINWLGQSVVASSGREETSLFTAGRPLIAVAFLSYFIAIIESIAVGLEHLVLLVILSIIHLFCFAFALTALVFSALSTSLDSNLTLFDFWNCLLIAICCISALQVYTTVYLVYEISRERRVERCHEYCLAKMVPSVDEFEL